MTDYSKNVDYAAKDALASGDALKLILGSDLASEFDELVTAIASKYDSSDLASQAQAVAGVSNTTLITPLRLAQALAGAGAGAVGDITALADPNADRGLFWDDSADKVDWFSLGTGIAFTGTVLGLDLANLDHNSLLNFVPNKHIDHTAVVLTAGSGLSGGGDISTSRSFAVSITSLTEDTTPQTSADYVMTYDNSATANKKVLLDNLVGASVGDGSWYRSTSQSIGVAAATTIVFDTAVADNLVRGTFSTGTGLYTCTSATGCRLLITTTYACPTLGSGRSFSSFIIKSGTIVGRGSLTASGGSHTTPFITLSRVLTLSFGDTVGVQAFFTTTANTVQAGESYSHLNIVELG